MNNSKGSYKSYVIVVLVIWFFTEVLFQSTIEVIAFWKKEDLNKFVSYLVLALLVFYIFFFLKYTLKDVVTIMVISVLVTIATLNSHYNIMMSSIIFIIASKDLDYEEAIKWVYYAQVAAIIIVFLLLWGGHIEDVVLYRGSIARHSYGFLHPNLFGIRMFHVTASRCYLRREKINFFDCVFIVIMALIVRHISDSKTAYFSLFALLAIVIIYTFLRLYELNMDSFAVAMILVAITMCAGSIVLSFIDVKSVPLLRNLDIVLSHRFSMCHKTLLYYGVKPFGQEILLFVKRPLIGSFYRFYLDNSYMAILLRYGYLLLTVFLYLYFGSMVYLKNHKQYFLLGMMCLFTIYGVMENNFFSMSQNVFLLLLSSFIYEQKQEENYVSRKRIRLIW